MEKPTFRELENRINAVKADGALSLMDAACWNGYIAALLEWGLIGVEDHGRLCGMLPNLDPDPTLRIFLG